MAREERHDDARRDTGVVTSVRAATGRPGWVWVCVDGRRVGAVPAEVASRLGVVVGADWSEGRAGAFARESAYVDALHAGLAILARGGRTREVVRERLRAKGHGEEATTQAVEELVRRGLIDEARAAAGLADGAARKSMAASAIEAKLVSMGHDVEQARRATAEAVRGLDAVEEAERLVRRRMKMGGRVEDAGRMRRRLAALLVRNGYEEDVVREVLRRVLGDGEG